MRVIDYQKIETCASFVKDNIKIEATQEELESLKKALVVMSNFENAISMSFIENRGYSPFDSRYLDTFKEIHFWFKDGFVMASVRTGSVG